MNSVV